MPNDREKGREKEEQSSEMPSNYVYKPWLKDILSLEVKTKDREQATTNPKKPQQE